MSAAKIHRVRHRIASQLTTGAKISVPTALKGAQDRVKALEPTLLAAIEAEFAVLDEAFRTLRSGDSAGVTALYETADRLVGLAAAAPRLAGFAKAALSLCDLLDSLAGAIPDDLRPIAVHLDALRALRGDAPERDQLVVLAGLAKLRGRYGPRPASG